MTSRIWCGWPDKHWKGYPGVCPCGWCFPATFHPRADGSWPRDPDAPRIRERLPEPEPRPRERLPTPRKRERLDLFDLED